MTARNDYPLFQKHVYEGATYSYSDNSNVIECKLRHGMLVRLTRGLNGFSPVINVDVKMDVNQSYVRMRQEKNINSKLADFWMWLLGERLTYNDRNQSDRYQDYQEMIENLR